MTPETDYAKTPGGHHIAYQVLGDGPLDLIYVHGVSHLDGQWEEPQFTGTGFPGDFYIKYHLYRNYWPLMALGRAAGRA